MAAKLTPTQQQDINELRSRLDWLEEERRKQARKIGELEQKLEMREREITGRSQRIQSLEEKVNTLTIQQARQLQFDSELAQFRDDIVKMIEGYDQRRLQSESEADRLRRMEHESTVREITDIRKSLPAIGLLEQAMELRQSEEARLATLIGNQQSRIASVEHAVESWEQEFSFVAEKEKQNRRAITEMETRTVENSKRFDGIYERIDLMGSGLPRLKNDLQKLDEMQGQIRNNMKSWLEQVQSGEYERNKRIEGWQRQMDEQKSVLDKFHRDWIPMSDQFQESKMALQSLSTWQTQQETQQRETAELMRVETHRLQARWENFRLENEKAWKTFKVEAEQRWGNLDRREQEARGQVHFLEEKLDVLRQEKERLNRIQAAQADAIKKIPLIWMEEVEKAINQDPNRRRQPALVKVRED